MPAKRTRRRRRRKPAHAEHHGERSSKASTGARIGSTLGSLLGGAIHRGIGRIFGRGEYRTALANHVGVEELAENDTPEVNSLVSPVSSDSIPEFGLKPMSMDSEGSIRIVRREFIDLIRIGSSDTTRTFSVNPGYAGVFPWLSGVARSWQQYALIGAAFEYIPTSGFAVGSESAALGYVAMAPIYNVMRNPGDWPFENLQGLLNYNGSVSGSPAAASTCYIECDPSQGNQANRFVYPGDYGPLPHSRQNYDFAQLVVSTGGAQTEPGNTFVAGQLWITYEIVLHQPRTLDPAASQTPAKFAELFQEYHALINFRGMLTYRARIRLEARIRLLEAYFASYDFLRQISQIRLDNRLHDLDEKESKTPPEYPESVKRLLDLEKEQCVLVQPPPQQQQAPGPNVLVHAAVGSNLLPGPPT